MVVASAILMVGIVSVVQLVPASVQSTSRNRYDTMATVIAQRELDQILAQPLSSTTPFQDADNWTVNLGGAGTAGAPITMYGPTTIIDFSVPASSVPDGYIKPDYVDPNDLSAHFEIRWAVITRTAGGVIIGKRFIIGCRQTNATTPVMPVSLDTSLQR
jgi:hypothetical protein